MDSTEQEVEAGDTGMIDLSDTSLDKVFSMEYTPALARSLGRIAGDPATQQAKAVSAFNSFI